jgi:hypothetical protein
MIKIWISPTHSTATIACAMHDEAKLKAASYSPGVFLTLPELEALARESFEAGVALVTWGIVTANCGEKRPPNFESFWAEYLKKMGE